MPTKEPAEADVYLVWDEDSNYPIVGLFLTKDEAESALASERGTFIETVTVDVEELTKTLKAAEAGDFDEMMRRLGQHLQQSRARQQARQDLEGWKPTTEH